MDTTGRMRFAYREMLAPGMGGLAIGVIFFLVVQYTVLGPLGPLGTGETLSWLQRLGFWSLVAGLQFPICYASLMLTLYMTRARRLLVVALGLMVMVVIAAASCAAIVFTVYGIFEGGRIPGVSLQKMYGVCVLNLFCVTALFYYVAWLRLNFVRPDVEEHAATHQGAVAGRLSDAGSVPSAGAGPIAAVGPATREGVAVAGGPPAETPAPSGRFFDRLPDDLGRDIIYLTASAHYVDVITAAGSTSILLRFSDAVAELGDIGIRVHRSHWVAFRHVKQALRRDGRTLLRLTGDHEVRVGRNYLPDVRDAVPKAWLRTRRREPDQAPPASSSTSS